MENASDYSLIDAAYSHYVTAYASTPSVGAVYSATNALPSTRVIDIGTGLFQGHSVQVSGYYGTSYFSGYSSNFSG